MCQSRKQQNRMLLTSLLISISIVFSSFGEEKESFDPPETNFELAHCLFLENLTKPLSFEVLSGPGVDTREIFLEYSPGSVEYLIFGHRPNGWIGFRVYSKFSKNSKEIVIKFEEISEPKNMDDILRLWKAFIDAVEGVKKTPGDVNEFSGCAKIYRRSVESLKLIGETEKNIGRDQETLASKQYEKLLDSLRVKAGK
jgi:hypothetical protein